MWNGGDDDAGMILVSRRRRGDGDKEVGERWRYDDNDDDGRLATLNVLTSFYKRQVL